MRDLLANAELLARAERVVPVCSQTFSKCPTQMVAGVAPNFLQRGKGCHVWDVDGNEYIDYLMGLGPVVLGYGYPAVDDAITEQLRSGTILSLAHPLEVEVSELICEIVPCAEMVRFGKNGSDVTAAAVRVARAYTGRDVVACSGYHGWQDWYIGSTSRAEGVPQTVRGLTVAFEHNGIESLERVIGEHRGNVAAVVIEPAGGEGPAEGYLEAVRELTQREGIVLVFDEVVSGCRLALGGAQDMYGVTPDLAAFGKAIANGMPLGAICGRAEIMRLFEEVFFSFTFGGECLSLAAARATIHELQTEPVIPHLYRQGERLRDGLNGLLREAGIDRHIRCAGLGPRTAMSFADEKGEEWLALRTLFQQEIVKRGILAPFGHCLSYSHTNEDVERTLAVYAECVPLWAEAIEQGQVAERLEGPPVEAIFRRQ